LDEWDNVGLIGCQPCAVILERAILACLETVKEQQQRWDQFLLMVTQEFWRLGHFSRAPFFASLLAALVSQNHLVHLCRVCLPRAITHPGRWVRTHISFVMATFGALFAIICAFFVSCAFAEVLVLDGLSQQLDNATFDYVVVGCGIAGLVVANRLSEDENVTVLCLEAGTL
jgi:hypothetical protein